MTARHAFLVDERANVDEALAHGNRTLDHPIERPAVEQLLAAFGHHTRRVLELALLAALFQRGQMVLLPGAKILDRIRADAELDEMKCQRPPFISFVSR
jgi:hypothetical protein